MKAEQQAAKVSGRFPVGTAVLYQRILSDPASKVATRIRSAAWPLGHGEIVIKVEGVAGGVLASALTVRACRVCGCTENDCRQCVRKTGGPCHWITDDLCSACSPDAEAVD
jgi:hypothetical protein